ncbi:MAG: hypothetical protein LBI69_03870 [Puniceicoccales bacterium]|nr:hypothetical protein [Puniceicoccales bacterium]
MTTHLFTNLNHAQNFSATANALENLKNAEILKGNLSEYSFMFDFNGEDYYVNCNRAKFSHCRTLLEALHGNGSFFISFKIFFVSLISALFGNKGFAFTASMLGYSDKNQSIKVYTDLVPPSGVPSSTDQQLDIPLQPVTPPDPSPQLPASMHFIPISNPQVNNIKLVNNENSGAFFATIFTIIDNTMYYKYASIRAKLENKLSLNCEAVKLNSKGFYERCDNRSPIIDLHIDKNGTVSGNPKIAIDDGFYLIRTDAPYRFFSSIAVVSGIAYAIEIQPDTSGRVRYYDDENTGKSYVKLLDNEERPHGYCEVER